LNILRFTKTRKKLFKTCLLLFFGTPVVSFLLLELTGSSFAFAGVVWFMVPAYLFGFTTSAHFFPVPTLFGLTVVCPITYLLLAFLASWPANRWEDRRSDLVPKPVSREDAEAALRQLASIRGIPVEEMRAIMQRIEEEVAAEIKKE